MNKVTVFAILFVSLISCSTHVSFGHEELNRDLNKNLVNDPKIKTDVLENGLRYAIRANTIPENHAEFRLAVQGESFD